MSIPPSTQSRPSVETTNAAPSTSSLISGKSIDSVPVTGTFPFGSLRINDPKGDMDMELATPLTIPDRSPEPQPSKETSLLTGGDALILDDLPSSFTIGCDTISFTTAQQFLGFRDIPPGAHLIWVAPSESTSSRSAYWIVTPEPEESSTGEVYVKQWDKFNEVLSEPASQAEERFQKEHLGEIFASLAPYHFRALTSALPLPDKAGTADPLPPFLSNTTIWQELTFAIQPTLLNRITGKVQPTWPINTSDRVAGETSLLEEARLYATSNSELNFTFPVDQLLFDSNAAGPERTQQALDPTSWISTGLTRTASSAKDLVGEFQFAFLTGMHLGNYSCLEQWWHYATRIVFRSYQLAIERPQLVFRLIQTFHAQLVYNDRYLEGNVMDTMPGNAQKMKKALALYKSRLTELLLALGDKCTTEQQAVGRAFGALESYLWRFGWDLRGDYVRSGTVMLEDGEMVHAELSDFEEEDERGDYAAVVVAMDENGRPTDFVSV